MSEYQRAWDCSTKCRRTHRLITKRSQAPWVSYIPPNLQIDPFRPYGCFIQYPYSSSSKLTMCAGLKYLLFCTVRNHMLSPCDEDRTSDNLVQRMFSAGMSFHPLSPISSRKNRCSGAWTRRLARIGYYRQLTARKTAIVETYWVGFKTVAQKEVPVKVRGSRRLPVGTSF